MNYAIILLILPLFAAFLSPLGSLFNKRFGRFLNPVIHLAGLALGVFLLFIYDGNAVIPLGDWSAPFGITLYAGPSALISGVVIYLVASALSIIDITEERSSYYQLLVNLVVFSGLGMVMTGDLFNLFVMIEIGTIAVLSLSASVSHKTGSRGAFKYAVIGGTVSMLMLAGIGMLYSTVGTLNFAHLSVSSAINGGLALLIGVLILSGLYLEAELFPFNFWVPEVYKGAGSSFSAGIAGIVGLGGAIAFARVYNTVLHPQSSFIYVYESIRMITIIVATVSVIIGEISALGEKDLKKVLAYSSIGQMGMAVLAFGVAGKSGIFAGLFLVIAHSLAKALLFFVNGYFIRQSGKAKWNEMKGIGRSFPLMAGLFAVGALSLMGIPAFAGFWGKFELLSALIKDHALYAPVAVVLIASIIEGIYFIRIAHTFFEKGETEFAHKEGSKVTVLIPSVVFALLILFVGTQPQWLNGIVDDAVEDLSDREGYVNAVLGDLSPFMLEPVIEMTNTNTNLIEPTAETVQPAITPERESISRVQTSPQSEYGINVEELLSVPSDDVFAESGGEL